MGKHPHSMDACQWPNTDRMKRNFEPTPTALAVRAVLIAATMSVSRVPAPTPESPKKPSTPSGAMGADEILRHVTTLGLTADPLVRRLVELLSAQIDTTEEQLAFAEEHLRETEHELTEAQARIQRLETLLDKEDVPRYLWAG